MSKDDFKLIILALALACGVYNSIIVLVKVLAYLALGR